MINIGKLLTKNNLFHAGSIISTIVLVVMMGAIYSEQSSQNLQANLLLTNTQNFKENVEEQEHNISELSTEYVANIPTHLSFVSQGSIDTNETTRYFELLEEEFKSQGEFSISSISYSSNSSSDKSLKSEDSLNISVILETSKSNLLKFLDIIESSGASNESFPYLMDVNTINFSVPKEPTPEDGGISDFEKLFSLAETSITEEDLFHLTLSLRIYNFKS